MASKSDIEAGRAFVRFYIENSALTKGLAQIQQQLTGLGRGIMAFGGLMTGLGASIIAPLVAAVLTFSTAGDALDKMSRRTGVAVETLDMLSFAAARSGTSIDTVEKAIRKAQQNGFAAEHFGAIADEIAAMGDHDAKVRRVSDIFGRMGPELIPMLEDLAGLNEEFERFGVKVDPADVKAAADLNDALGDVSAFAGRIAFQLGASLAPAIMPVLDTVKKIGAATFVWIQNNGETVRLIGAIAIGLVVAGTAAIALGATLVGVGATVGSIMTIWSGLVAAVTFLATPLGIVVVIIGVIGAAILAAIGYWLLFTDHGRGFVRVMLTGIRELTQKLGAMFGPALKALRSGEMQLAWKIVVEGMKAIWFQALEQMLKKIRDLARAMVDSGVLGPSIKLKGPNLLDEAIRGAGLDAKIAEATLKRLQQQAEKLKPSDDPNSPGYGLQEGGQRLGKVIGFSAHAALLAGNIVGTGSKPEDKIVGKLEEVVRKLHPLAAEMMMLRRALEGHATFK